MVTHLGGVGHGTGVPHLGAVEHGAGVPHLGALGHGSGVPHLGALGHGTGVPHLMSLKIAACMTDSSVVFHLFTHLLVELSRVPPIEGSALPSLTAGVDPLETDTSRPPPWELAVHFDESDAVGERDLASAAAVEGCAHVFQRIQQLILLT